MAYRRRRRGFPWPWLFLALLIVGAGAYAARSPSGSVLAERLLSRVSPTLAERLMPRPATVSSAPGFAEPAATSSAGTPIVSEGFPLPDIAATTFLDDWQSGNYTAMYGLLSASAKKQLTQDQFVKRYGAITSEATITSLKARITSIPTLPPKVVGGASVQVPFTVDFKTIRVGDFSENNSVPLIFESGAWHVDWHPSLIFQDLTGNSLVRLFPLNPRRGSILDRTGRPLATQGFLVAVGVIPAKLKTGNEDATLQILSGYLKKTPAELKKVFANQPPDWFIPLGDLPWTMEQELNQKLGPLPGVELRRKPIRVYPFGDSAAQVVGYVGHVTPEELKKLAPKGYTIDDLVGRAGVEAAMDTALAGVRGGKLAIVSPTGEVIKIIAQRDAIPGDDVHLTIDMTIQQEAEKVLGSLDGSIVLLDPRDNSVLALADYPRYNPNYFVQGFPPGEWQKLSTDKNHPFLFRPVEATFATGSVFKVITMAAGMEKAGYKPTDTFDCSYWWHGLPGVTLHNWRPEGTLNLIQSLTGSCDPTFYTIGLALDRINPNILPTFARGFGLGEPTGINGVTNESAGLVPDPAWKEKTYHQPWYTGDSINLAIGQGYLQATPLQVANLYSALANGGTLKTPVLVHSLTDYQGKVVKTFVSQVKHRLPASPSTLAAIREGMAGVTSTPLGTAYYAFQTYKVPMGAKTGSAENQGPLAHAWFAGYAPFDNPRYNLIVMVEGKGESMQIAAPRARQMMDFLIPK